MKTDAIVLWQAHDIKMFQAYSAVETTDHDDLQKYSRDFCQTLSIDDLT